MPVSINDPIEFYPRDDPIEIDEDAQKKISCSSSGQQGKEPKDQLLSWHRVVNGQEIKLDAPDKVEHEDQVSPTGNHIDYANLLFSKFSKADEGVYICKRTLHTNVQAKNVTLKLISK